MIWEYVRSHIARFCGSATVSNGLRTSAALAAQGALAEAQQAKDQAMEENLKAQETMSNKHEWGAFWTIQRGVSGSHTRLWSVAMAVCDTTALQSIELMYINVWWCMMCFSICLSYVVPKFVPWNFCIVDVPSLFLSSRSCREWQRRSAKRRAWSRLLRGGHRLQDYSKDNWVYPY